MTEDDIKYLENVMKERGNYNLDTSTQTCLHDLCPDCFGTRKKQDESRCTHMIECHCPKCIFRYDI